MQGQQKKARQQGVPDARGSWSCTACRAMCSSLTLCVQPLVNFVRASIQKRRAGPNYSADCAAGVFVHSCSNLTVNLPSTSRTSYSDGGPPIMKIGP